jgi:hypothetical protein
MFLKHWLQWLSILSSLNSFQIISHASLLYYKHCDVNTLENYNINTIFYIKT